MGKIPWICWRYNRWAANGQNHRRSDHDYVIKWKHFPRYKPFVWGNHRWAVNFPHKCQWCGALMFSLICAWTHGLENNRDAGDLDAIVFITTSLEWFNSFRPFYRYQWVQIFGKQEERWRLNCQIYFSKISGTRIRSLKIITWNTYTIIQDTVTVFYHIWSRFSNHAPKYISVENFYMPCELSINFMKSCSTIVDNVAFTWITHVCFTLHFKD